MVCIGEPFKWFVLEVVLFGILRTHFLVVTIFFDRISKVVASTSFCDFIAKKVKYEINYALVNNY